MTAEPLPTITYRKKVYTFDYRLRQLRTADRRQGIIFLNLSDSEADLIDFALKSRDEKLIKANISEVLRNGDL